MEDGSRGVCLYSCVSESDPGQTAPDPENVPLFCVAWRHSRRHCFLLATRIHLQRGRWVCLLLQVKCHVVVLVQALCLCILLPVPRDILNVSDYLFTHLKQNILCSRWTLTTCLFFLWFPQFNNIHSNNIWTVEYKTFFG